MSERGSFVTEYIYCDKCLEAAKKVLIGRDKALCSCFIPSWTGVNVSLPIIAGKIGADQSAMELFEFEYNIVPELEKVICCDMRIAVLADSGENEIFTAKAINQHP